MCTGSSCGFCVDWASPAQNCSLSADCGASQSHPTPVREPGGGLMIGQQPNSLVLRCECICNLHTAQVPVCCTVDKKRRGDCYKGTNVFFIIIIFFELEHLHGWTTPKSRAAVSPLSANRYLCEMDIMFVFCNKLRTERLHDASNCYNADSEVVKSTWIPLAVNNDPPGTHYCKERQNRNCIVFGYSTVD